MATVVGIAVCDRAPRTWRRAFNNIMDMLQLVFAFVNAPLFATFLLGMFWKRTTGHGAFWGLVAGTLAAALHHELTAVDRRRLAASEARAGARLRLATWRRTSGARSGPGRSASS